MIINIVLGAIGLIALLVLFKQFSLSSKLKGVEKTVKDYETDDEVLTLENCLRSTLSSLTTQHKQHADAINQYADKIIKMSEENAKILIQTLIAAQKQDSVSVKKAKANSIEELMAFQKIVDELNKENKPKKQKLVKDLQSSLKYGQTSTEKFDYVREGGTFIFNLSKEDIKDKDLSKKFTVCKKAPLDLLLEGISFSVFVDNPENPGVGDVNLTDSYKINIRDRLSGDSWIVTNKDDTVPVIALAEKNPLREGQYISLTGKQYRPLYQNYELEVTIEPADGVEIIDFVISFIGRRMDMMPQWERDFYLQGDPRTQGVQWIYLKLDKTSCDYKSYSFRFPTAPYNMNIENMSVYHSDMDQISPNNKLYAHCGLLSMKTKKIIIDQNSCFGNKTENIKFGLDSGDSLEITTKRKISPDTTPIFDTHIVFSGYRGANEQHRIGFPYKKTGL